MDAGGKRVGMSDGTTIRGFNVAMLEPSPHLDVFIREHEG